MFARRYEHGEGLYALVHGGVLKKCFSSARSKAQSVLEGGAILRQYERGADACQDQVLDEAVL